MVGQDMITTANSGPQRTFYTRRTRARACKLYKKVRCGPLWSAVLLTPDKFRFSVANMARAPFTFRSETWTEAGLSSVSFLVFLDFLAVVAT